MTRSESTTFERLDLADTGAVAVALRRFQCDAVIHMAADSLVGESVGEPAKYFRNNVVGRIIFARRHARDRRAASGLLVHGRCLRPTGQAADRGMDPTEPTNPYGETKLAFERALRWYAAAYGLGSVSLRYFNAAGATDGNGERHDPETHLIPLVLQAAAGELPHVTVFGNDYPTPDGTCVRDYIHVEDLARAHVLALEAAGGGGRAACTTSAAAAPATPSVRSSIPRPASPAALFPRLWRSCRRPRRADRQLRGDSAGPRVAAAAPAARPHHRLRLGVDAGTWNRICARSLRNAGAALNQPSILTTLRRGGGRRPAVSGQRVHLQGPQNPSEVVITVPDGMILEHELACDWGVVGQRRRRRSIELLVGESSDGCRCHRAVAPEQIEGCVFGDAVEFVGVRGIHLVDVIHRHAGYRRAVGERLCQLDLDR